MSESKMKKRKSEGEGRDFQERWDNTFFTAVHGKTFCFIYNNVASVLTVRNL